MASLRFFKNFETLSRHGRWASGKKIRRGVGALSGTSGLLTANALTLVLAEDAPHACFCPISTSSFDNL
ncbi:hypothetical protein BRCON_1786 [Candidatus Sumerlaea chitinivorans]|uniref:Uncharacterized protein n=1 Tax=Sumerlaea chitinivorans TaxID=2250252 RepID=A0A2Z4Y801_SUMC1|nr:hypothetical protein BRCON_1786 [Candidatus Sumerlaea chitinivorans]